MISFVDDDDIVSDDYFKLITETIERNQNLDAIQIFCYVINKSDTRYNSYTFKGLKQNFINILPFVTKNTTNRFQNSIISQLNPIKTSIVKSVKYPNIPIHEDLHFALGVQSKIKTVDTISKSIYDYHYNTSTSAVQEYRKPKTELLKQLNTLYTDQTNLLQYDLSTGRILDPRYFKIIENNNQ